jgi:hypothetical protein
VDFRPHAIAQPRKPPSRLKILGVERLFAYARNVEIEVIDASWRICHTGEIGSDSPIRSRRTTGGEAAQASEESP